MNTVLLGVGRQEGVAVISKKEAIVMKTGGKHAKQMTMLRVWSGQANMGRRAAFLLVAMLLFGLYACESIREKSVGTDPEKEEKVAVRDDAAPPAKGDPKAMAAKAPPSEMAAKHPSAEPAATAVEMSETTRSEDKNSASGRHKTRKTEAVESFQKGIFTAYTSQRHQTDGTPFISADGTNLQTVNGCVVANNHLPFGTRVEIESIGECVVRDRGADGHPSHWFDVYMGQDHDRAVKFGRQELNYRIIQ